MTQLISHNFSLLRLLVDFDATPLIMVMKLSRCIGTVERNPIDGRK